MPAVTDTYIRANSGLPAGPATNLLANPDFTNGITFWDPYFTTSLAAQSAVAYDGNSMKVDIPDTTTAHGTLVPATAFSATVPDGTRIGVRLRLKGVSGQQVVVSGRVYQANDTYIAESLYQASNSAYVHTFDGSWQDVAIWYSAVFPGGFKPGLQIVYPAGGPATAFYVDNALVEVLPPTGTVPNPYYKGSVVAPSLADHRSAFFGGTGSIADRKLAWYASRTGLSNVSIADHERAYSG